MYARRWSVELFYRHFKQTYQRRKLRSHTADHAELEATWSLLGLWAMTLHTEVEVARANPDAAAERGPNAAGLSPVDAGRLPMARGRSDAA